MRLAFALVLLLILTGCGGGSASRSGNPNRPNGGVSDAAGTVKLTLDAEEQGGEWRVNLRAPQATDLYQVAGTLTFDALKYEVVAVEAGGGLGQPEDSYFVGRETEPGRVAFAYTKRYHGSGVSGDTWLVSLRVRPTGKFNAADFKLLQGERQLTARDSRKRRMTVTVGGAK
jgi:hypothetical protein